MVPTVLLDINQENILVEKAKLNPAEFKPLYEKYYKTIFLFVLHRVNDKQLAADLTSQVFLKALVNLKRYAVRGVPFSAWLYRIAINEINSFFRKRKSERHVAIDEEGLLTLKDELIEEVPLEHLRPKLQGILQNLSEHELYLIELRFFEELSFKTIGEILSITEVHAKVKTYRVLDKLRKFLTSGK